MTLDEIKKQIFIDSEDVCGNIMIDTYQAQDYVGMAYNKAIDDFMEKIDDDICNDCSKCGNGCRLLELRQIAEQLKAGEQDK